MPLRVLLVDDSEDEALLLLRELRRGGYEPQWRRVDTADDLIAALARNRWDVMLCDYVMPQFSGPAALNLVQQCGVDVPVIIVSGQIGEEFTVAAMRAGARDYVMKDNLARLVPTIERELREAQVRLARQRAEDALHESEARIRRIAENASDIIYRFRVAPVRGYEYVSPAALAMTGYAVEEYYADPDLPLKMVHPDDRHVLASLEESINNAREALTVTVRWVCKDGSVIWTDQRMVPVRDASGTVVAIEGITRDVTELKRTEAQKVALLDVARDISGTLDLGEILDRVQRRVAALLPCDRVATFSWDARRGASRIVAQYGIPEDARADAAAVEFVPGQPIVEWVESGQTVLINDPGVQPWLPTELLARFDLAAVVGVPLLTGDRLKGVIVAARTRPGRGFEAGEVQLFEAIARQLAVAIGAAELYRVQEEEAQVSAALARVGQELIASFDRPAVVNGLCRLTAEVLACDCSHTALWNPAEQAYAIVGAFGDSPEQRESISVLKIPLAVLAGLAARLRRDGVVQVVMGEPQDLLPAGLLAAYGITVGMYAALYRGEEFIGIQTAGYRGPKARFTTCQERIFRGVAQLASLALEHARVVDELERANRLKYDFIATMSHELRTPLNVMMGYSDLLLEGEFGALSGEQSDICQRIDRSARQLLELINATLDLSRLESGKLTPDLVDVRLSELLRELEAETRELQCKPGVRVSWRIPARTPHAWTDPLKLKVVIKNLLANAVKFTDAGEVTVNLAARDSGVEVAVSDTGVGIASEALPIIFEPFRQLDSSTTRRYGGVGLGLYIVRRLVELIGGKISVDSDVGHGSTFRVWLPGTKRLSDK